MSKLRVHSFSISIDGFGAGPDQDLENPLGVGGLRVFDWFFPTRTWQRMHGNEDGEPGVDDAIVVRGFEGKAFSLNWLKNSGQQKVVGSIIWRHD